MTPSRLRTFGDFKVSFLSKDMVVHKLRSLCAVALCKNLFPPRHNHLSADLAVLANSSDMFVAPCQCFRACEKSEERGVTRPRKRFFLHASPADILSSKIAKTWKHSSPCNNLFFCTATPTHTHLIISILHKLW